MVAGVDGKRGRAVDSGGLGPAPLLPASHPLHLTCPSGFLPGSASPPQLHKKITRGAFLTPMPPIKSEWTGQGWCPAAFGGEERAGSFWGKG